MRCVFPVLAVVVALAAISEVSRAAGRGGRGGVGGIGRSAGSSFGVGGVQRSVGPSFGSGGVNRGGLSGQTRNFSRDRYGAGSTDLGRSNRSDPRRAVLNSAPLSRGETSRYAAPPSGEGVSARDWSQERQRINAERNLEHRLGQADHLRTIGERIGNDRLFGTSDRMARQARDHYELRLGHLGTAASGEAAAPYGNVSGQTIGTLAAGPPGAVAVGRPPVAQFPAPSGQRPAANWPSPTARTANRPGPPMNLPAAAANRNPYAPHVPAQGGPAVQLPGRSIYAPAVGQGTPPATAADGTRRSGFGSSLRRFWPFGN